MAVLHILYAIHAHILHAYTHRDTKHDEHARTHAQRPGVDPAQGRAGPPTICAEPCGTYSYRFCVELCLELSPKIQVLYNSVVTLDSVYANAPPTRFFVAQVNFRKPSQPLWFARYAYLIHTVYVSLSI